MPNRAANLFTAAATFAVLATSCSNASEHTNVSPESDTTEKEMLRKDYHVHSVDVTVDSAQKSALVTIIAEDNITHRTDTGHFELTEAKNRFDKDYCLLTMPMYGTKKYFNAIFHGSANVDHTFNLYYVFTEKTDRSNFRDGEKLKQACDVLTELTDKKYVSLYGDDDNRFETVLRPLNPDGPFFK